MISDMDKTTQHNGMTCQFSEAGHSYTIQETGQKLVSVTTLLKQFTPAFNAPAMAQRMIDKQKPAYLGMSAKAILNQWKAKTDQTSQEGTLLHAYCEAYPATKGYGFNPQLLRTFEMTKQVDKIFPKLLERFELVESEKMVFSARLGLSGMIDLLMRDPANGQMIIIDWKTNSKDLTDEVAAFGDMLEPIGHLANADTVQYGLQLELYRKILEEEKYYPDCNGYRKAIVHIKPAAAKVVKVKDYPAEVERILGSEE